MKTHKFLKIMSMYSGFLILTAVTSWSGEYKNHRHGVWTHPHGNNHPFSSPKRYTGHRHGVWTHEVKRATKSISAPKEKYQKSKTRPRKNIKAIGTVRGLMKLGEESA